jgi:hypothetical protein
LDQSYADMLGSGGNDQQCCQETESGYLDQLSSSHSARSN